MHTCSVLYQDYPHKSLLMHDCWLRLAELKGTMFPFMVKLSEISVLEQSINQSMNVFQWKTQLQI